MRVFKYVPCQIKEHLQELYTACDVCGLDTQKGGFFDATKITVEARIGQVYPDAEGDGREVAMADICAGCFSERVKPALVSAGVRFREYRGDEPEPKLVDGKVER